LEIEIRVNKKIARIAAEELEVYANQEDWWGDQPFHLLEKEGKKVLSVVRLTTGNIWWVERRGRFHYLHYKGSRHGFRAMTPFENIEILPKDEKHALIRFADTHNRKYPNQLTVYTARITLYNTTNSHLKWWERIEQLHEQPEQGVVFDWFGIPLRVMSYKNVFSPNSSPSFLEAEKMKVGLLKKGFEIRTISNISVAIPKGTLVTKVTVEGTPQIVFLLNGTKDYSNQPVKLFKVGQRYYAEVFGAIYQLQAFEPQPPFPACWL